MASKSTPTLASALPFPAAQHMPGSPAAWCLFGLLLASALVTANLPLSYFFVESFLFSGFFLLLILGLWGSGLAFLSTILAYGLSHLVLGSEAFLPARFVQLVFICLVCLFHQKGLMFPVMLYGPLIGVPLMLLASRLGWMTAGSLLPIILAKDFVESLTVAMLAEISLTHVPLPSWLPQSGTMAASLRRNGIPLRNILLQAAFGPIFTVFLVLFVLSGLSAQEQMIQDARTSLVTVRTNLASLESGWSEQERQALLLGSPYQRRRLVDALSPVMKAVPGIRFAYTDGGLPETAPMMEQVQPTDRWLYRDLGGNTLLLSPDTNSRFIRWDSLSISMSARFSDNRFLLYMPLYRSESPGTMLGNLAAIAPMLGLLLFLMLLTSRYIEGRLSALSESTAHLPDNLLRGIGQPIAHGRIRELNVLAGNFQTMGYALEELFAELQTANEDLQAQSERLRESESALFRLAHHDALTGLPNRTYLHASVARFLADSGGVAGGQRSANNGVLAADQAGTMPGTSLAMLLVDLDRFKPINDLHGHAVGDATLVHVGEIFRQLVGDDPTRGSFAVRLGGDEFAVVLPGTDAAGAVQLAQQLIESLESPFVVQGLDLQVYCSIGISLYPDHGATTSALLRRADRAMYRAKQEGGRTWSMAGEVDADEA